jgi:2-amino-4-hydroxy-6-hydroxymethyldihydropteridine diphosphokinase
MIWQGAVVGNYSNVMYITEKLCLIALGSNLGTGPAGPADVLDAALLRLESCGFVIRARSRYFTTPAFPAGAGPDFVNAAVAATTSLDAAQTLAQLHQIEAAMGRVREVRWGPRTLDLDLLALGADVVPDLKTHAYWRDLPAELQQCTAPAVPVVPHPRLAERAFVLVPLLDVAPEWCHPVTGLSVRQMHDALPREQVQTVVAL